MHSRCCWPPERLRPSSCSLSLTSSHIAASRSASSTRSPSSLRGDAPRQPQPEGDVVEDRHGKRRRLLEHHADAEAQVRHVDGWARGCPPHRAALPQSARWPGYSAYMRLKTRSSVDLPQPEGPMKAVIWRSASVRLMSLSACGLAVVEIRGAARRTSPRRPRRPAPCSRLASSCASAALHQRLPAGFKERDHDARRDAQHEDAHRDEQRARTRRAAASSGRGSARTGRSPPAGSPSGASRLVLQNWLLSAVNSSGAVSPLMRATASSSPVTMPLRAAG